MSGFRTRARGRRARWARACAACILATVWIGAGPPDESPKPTRRGYSIFDFEEFKGVGGLPGFVPQGWYARIETDKGPIVARLLPDQAPQSVAHFAALAEGRLEWRDPFTGEARTDPYYDGVVVHKAVTGEWFEAGDRTGTGRGAPPFLVPPEGQGPVTFNRPWRMGMTRSSLRRISGVVFFVTATILPSFIGRHPCFAEVIGGQDVVRAICNVRTQSDGTPTEPIVIHRIRIFKIGAPPPLPEPVPYEPEFQPLKPKPLPP